MEIKLEESIAANMLLEHVLLEVKEKRCNTGQNELFKEKHPPTEILERGDPLADHMFLAQALINMANGSFESSKPMEQAVLSEPRSPLRTSEKTQREGLRTPCCDTTGGEEERNLDPAKKVLVLGTGNDKLGAKESLTFAPPQVSLVNPNSPDSGSGVWARVSIPPRTLFGPYEGKKVPPRASTAYSWLVRKKNGRNYCVDASDPCFSNWMRLINCARTDGEQNLFAFQFRGKIFYKTTRQVNPQEELLVWRAAEDNVLEPSDGSALEGIYFQCPTCQYIHANRSNMNSHKKTCPKTRASSETRELSERNRMDRRVGHPSTKKANSRRDCSSENSETHSMVNNCEADSSVSGELDKSVSLKEPRKNVLSVKNRFVCSQCNECFGDEKMLSSHLLTHTQKNNFVCHKCKAVFSTGSTFIAHLVWHSGDKPTVGRTDVDVDDHNKPPQANKTKIHQENTKKFPLRKNSETSKCNQTENNPVACPQCKKRLSSKWTLKTHLMLHRGEKRHVCPECNTRFVSSISLKRHLVTHTGERPHVCPSCKKGFRFPWNLKTHIKIHEANNVCPKCKKRFPRKDSLKVHLRVHSGEKSHACTQCNEKFRFQANLRLHFLVHKEGKPFGCLQCKKRYRQKCNLGRHVRIHHG